MTQRRPRIYTPAKAPLTTEQKVTGLERTSTAQAEQIEQQGETIVTIVETVDGLPPTDSIWSDGRPEAGFGVGAEPSWTAIGNGSATTITIAGRLSTNPARYRVTVGGVLQPPAVYSLSAGVETLVFAEAPPAGVTIHITAPFYGSSS